jgi:threonine/homoserine/homoserine lactone efflux protein
MVDLAAFTAVSALVIVTPGPDTALTIRNTLLGGRRSGVFTAMGVSTGQVTWALATSAGLAALLTASEPAFIAVKLLGAAYLAFLGFSALRGALHADARAGEGAVMQRSRPTTAVRALRQGVISNLANPKMAAFFTGLLPQFAGAEHSTFLPLLVLGVAFSLMTLAWLSAYAVAIAWAGDALIRPRVRRALNALTGTVLIALGLRIATESR